MDVDDTLRWAALYAALSVRVPTGAGGATKLDEFVAEGTRRGLPAPPSGVVGWRRRPRESVHALGRLTTRADVGIARAASLGRVKWTWRGDRASSSPAAVAGARRARADARRRHAHADGRRPPASRRCANARRPSTSSAGPRTPRSPSSPASRGPRSGTFWTHNDSGDGPRVFELDDDGAFRARGRACTNAEAVDWEDIAIRGYTLYVGDIGDNLGQRRGGRGLPLRDPASGRPRRRRRSRSATRTARTTPRRCSWTRATASWRS